MQFIFNPLAYLFTLNVVMIDFILLNFE